jgi:hypothetical protein
MSTIDSCARLTSKEKLQCFDLLLESELENNGLAPALRLFVELYNADPEVPAVCHDWAHSLGAKSYELYRDGEDIGMQKEATFCSYGFFHGFVSAMVRDTQSFTGALVFCEELVADLGEELPSIENNCIHGIGHSIATQFLEAEDTWGDFVAGAEGGLPLCEELYATSRYREICYEGLFHELHTAMLDSDYGLDLTEYLSHEDLFYYCKQVLPAYKRACFYDFSGISEIVFKDDKKAALLYIVDSLDDVSVQGQAIIRMLARSWIEHALADQKYDEAVSACARLEGVLLYDCVGGLAYGFVEHGEGSRRHEQAFSFCIDNYTEVLLQHCTASVYRDLQFVYDKEELTVACEYLQPPEREGICEIKE